MDDYTRKVIERHEESLRNLDRVTSQHSARIAAMENWMSSIATDVKESKEQSSHQHTETMMELAEIKSGIRNEKEYKRQKQERNKLYASVMGVSVAFLSFSATIIARVFGLW